MILRVEQQPFASPRARAARLPYLVLLGSAYLLLGLWNPVTTPGPMLCAARLAFALPCPLCGATRGVSLCLRGQPVEAAAYNPLAVPIAALGIVLMLKWSYEYLANRAIVVEWQPPWGRVVVHLTTAAFLATWAYLIVYRREDDFTTSWLGQLLHHLW